MQERQPNAVILHGTSETKESFWLPWLTKELEKRGYSVSVPALPDADHPDLAKWLPKALEETYTEDTILIGHSAGGPLMLSVLENINVRIKQALIVSGYARQKGELAEKEPILQDQYDWEKIRANAQEIILLNSDNDPWGCDDIEGRYIIDQLGTGKLIVMKGEGHMGSDKFNQPYREFPFLLRLID